MDEDDSQDELINRSASHGKGKRTAVWAISDDSDSGEEESEEGESDSGEEEEESHPDGENDEEEEDDEEEDDEEGDATAEDGALGGPSIDLAETSSDEDTEKCPICLNSFRSQPVATPESCEHYFCLDCILAWAKNANSCPVDRIAFNSIYLRKCYGGKVKKMITVQKPVKEGQEEIIDLDLEQTSCEVCGGSDREDRLLLCDGCDSGYHMECLTPALNSVPVEEWFCPECVASNRHITEDVSDTESLPSTAHPATSRLQHGAAGPTRAIARTQQSERVRANVNRHRITQARTSQLAPTYLMQSTWLDDTINAVVSGLNTAVYVRDLTPRVPSSSKRKTGKRRKVKRRKGKTGKGVKRRKGRKTKSRRSLMLKKAVTSRSRIANNLRIVKDKKSSSLPTVYRPSEQTLSSMRADIGAASLSILGDPFDLDPFSDRIDLIGEEEVQQARITTLLEAKRRGISRSALRSHQPVARPVTAGLSRRGMNVHQSAGEVEVAPVPDLLGSILSGQSVLMLDSSDVVINRDGTLKAIKPMMPSALNPSCSSSSGDVSAQISPVMSPNQGDSSPSLYSNGDLPGSSHRSMNIPLSQSSSRLPPQTPCSSSHSHSSSHSDLPPRGHPRLQPPHPVRPTRPPGHLSPLSQSQPKKAPPKPMWVDVSVLPRIPKKKRESSDIAHDGTSQGGSNQSTSGRGSGSNSSSSSSNGHRVPEAGINSFAGDKGRPQSLDQPKGRADGQAPRQRPDGAGSSSTFSNSFSSSSSPSGSSASQTRNSLSSSSSSSSSAVSFRINSSGNSWQSRQLSSSSSPAAGSRMPTPRSKKEDEAKNRQLHRDKRMLASPEQDSDNIYDPFDPTLSDSGSSDDEAESASLDRSSQHATHEGKALSLGNKKSLVKSKPERVTVKTETQEIEVSQEEPRRAGAPETTPQRVRCVEENVKVEKESRFIDKKTQKPTSLLATCQIKSEPGLDNTGKDDKFGHRLKSLKSEKVDDTPPVQHRLDFLKTERETLEEESGRTDCKNNPSASSSNPTKKKLNPETKSDSASSSTSRDLGHKKKTFQVAKEKRSSSSEAADGRGEHLASVQGGRRKEKEKDRGRSSRRSSSRERTRRAYSTSESSQCNSPDKTRGKRRRSRSRSKDERRSRSGSSSSSKDRSKRNKMRKRSKERDVDRRRVSTDKRHGRSRSKSRSRSRSREKRKEHTQLEQSSLSSKDKVESRPKDKRRHRSRSSSREKRKEESSSKSFQKTSGSGVSSSKDAKLLQGKTKEKDISRSSLKEDKAAAVNKQKVATSELRIKGKAPTSDSQDTTAEMMKEMPVTKKIKKEKQTCLDMFENPFSLTKKIKKEETDTYSLMVAERVEEEGNKEHPVKTEKSEIKTEQSEIKTEQSEIKTEKSEIETEKSEIETEKFEIKTEKFENKTETFEIKTEKFKNKTEKFENKTEKFENKTEKFQNKTEKFQNKTEKFQNKTEKFENKTEKFKNKTETVEISIIKAEPSFPELCHLTPSTSFSTPPPGPADGLQDPVSESHTELLPSREQQDPVPVKQEAPQPSDSDDDFNVDVMLDTLDCVKSERSEDSAAPVKQEAEIKEETDEQASPAVGAKSKTQVKRVTWNIQEPEGPQPEKSASKLSLYKLKLKQEGARRPSSGGQTSSRESTGAAKRGAGGALGSSSTSDGEPGEAEEGDLSRKDQYLRKLHMQERAIEEVKLAIKPFYQKRDIDKDEYKEIVRKAVQKVCHSKSGEINPVKVGNLVKAYVDKYKHARKHKKEDDSGQPEEEDDDMSP
ncbi:PHD and RING finger domain-containing protein 1 [Liparis tanakae]|uniref:PHD and RING finger domain-containing protein 1 n=1 Tax=Liparis tanakae TaxID=230148 RepID=A0A4Z2JDI2_9TELE|nr:PHD and RING finger domain-containing protein 1 [Liparis tanakae]